MGGERESKRAKKTRVAYFCMEYGVSQDISLYCGGLGILAGDIVKESSDASLPLTAIGIFWNEGYTKQTYTDKAQVQDAFPASDRSVLVDLRVRDISVTIEGTEVKLSAYRVKGHENLILLEPTDEDLRKKYSNRLYQGGEEIRIAQEIILGVGGVRLLRAADIDVDVYHFNEGHAVFAGLELIKEEIDKSDDKNGGEDDDAVFRKAWDTVKKSIVFTTHTPVPAGNEEHKTAILTSVGASCGLSEKQLVAIGGDPFGMTVAGLRLAFLSNAVAKLHGETAREMWKGVTGSSKIITITNGVHAPSWQNPTIKEAFDAKTLATLDLSKIHTTAKEALFDEIKERTNVQLDKNILTVGFARRAATYKRANLIFQDIDRIGKLLKNKKLQLVFAGKAHPEDADGKKLISSILTTQQAYPESVVYVPNYDIKLGGMLTRGVDVWLNNPVRPKEASGTSGMKAAMNGVLNLSVLDGWWPEACEHGENGWKIGDETNRDEDSAAKIDHEALMTTIEKEVIPCYYDKKDKWTEMQKKSINCTAHDFSATRMMQEYYSELYEKQPL